MTITDEVIAATTLDGIFGGTFLSISGDIVAGKRVAAKICVQCEFPVIGLETKLMAMFSS